MFVEEVDEEEGRFLREFEEEGRDMLALVVVEEETMKGS